MAEQVTDAELDEMQRQLDESAEWCRIGGHSIDYAVKTARRLIAEVRRLRAELERSREHRVYYADLYHRAVELHPDLDDLPDPGPAPSPDGA